MLESVVNAGLFSHVGLRYFDGLYKMPCIRYLFFDNTTKPCALYEALNVSLEQPWNSLCITVIYKSRCAIRYIDVYSHIFIFLVEIRIYINPH